ncbi:MAG: serine protease [Desulfomonile sp.]|nr:serine protease [Deltaproteobacteria bacterium]
MDYVEWVEAVETVEPHVVRIMTPQCSGTGFLVSHFENSLICAIATAAHVVSHAQYWEQPIRIEHKKSGKTILLRSADRAIFLHAVNDTAAIVFANVELPLPDKPLDLPPENRSLKVGNEIGWLGFPDAVAHGDLCFFSGRVSAYREKQFEYLVDGVAINGVSGGPAFWNGASRVTLVGVMRAYIANRATGETLPGLSVVTNVDKFHELSKLFKSVDEAKEKESPPKPPNTKPESSNPALNRTHLKRRR